MKMLTKLEGFCFWQAFPASWIVPSLKVVMNKYSVNLIIQHFPTLIDKTWQVFIKSSYNKFDQTDKLRRKF